MKGADPNGEEFNKIPSYDNDEVNGFKIKILEVEVKLSYGSQTSTGSISTSGSRKGP